MLAKGQELYKQLSVLLPNYWQCVAQTIGNTLQELIDSEAESSQGSIPLQPNLYAFYPTLEPLKEGHTLLCSTKLIYIEISGVVELGGSG